MGAWLGAIGGAGMIALIAVLFFVFLRQMGVSLPSEAPRSMAAACAVALAELMFAGLFCTMGREPVSLLDLRAVWRGWTFWLSGLWPFNAYLAMLMGAWVAWSVRRVLGRRWMGLFLACPGSVLLFLPTPAAAVAFGAILALRIVLRCFEVTIGDRDAMLSYPLYLALLAVLSLLSAALIIRLVGVV